MMKKWALLLWKEIKNLWEKFTSESLLQGLLIFLLVVLAVFFLIVVCTDYPIWTKRYLGLTEKNETLTFLGVGMGGVLLALQAVIANRRAKAMEKQANAQAKSVEIQAEAVREQAKANQATEEGRRQNRQKDAIDHLGDDSESVRLSSAHELFQLAQDTPGFRATVLSILCAHIRRTTGESEYREKYKSKPSEEIQSLLTLLFVQEHEVFKGLHINLQGSWLNGANLERARLSRAVLTEAYLQRARLLEVQLDKARLEAAQLQKADLTGAHLQGALFVKAHLQGAILSNARLQGSILNEAWLHGAILVAAHLQETGLNATYLQGAYLAGAHLQEASLGGAHLQGANLHMARLHGAILMDARMQGAYLTAAQLHGVQFSSLQNSRHLSEAVRQEINPRPIQLQGASSSMDDRGWAFGEQIRKRRNKKADLSGVIFSGGLTKQYRDSLIEGLSEAGARKLQEALEPHIDQPVSHELPEDSGAITGAYTAEEAEQWIAEYNEAISEVPEADDN